MSVRTALPVAQQLLLVSFLLIGTLLQTLDSLGIRQRASFLKRGLVTRTFSSTSSRRKVRVILRLTTFTDPSVPALRECFQAYSLAETRELSSFLESFLSNDRNRVRWPLGTKLVGSNYSKTHALFIGIVIFSAFLGNLEREGANQGRAFDQDEHIIDIHAKGKAHASLFLEGLYDTVRYSRRASGPVGVEGHARH